MSELVNECIDDLLGTCNLSIEEWIEENKPSMSEKDRLNFIEAVSETISLCQQCGWWFEVGELDEEGICIDCVDE